MSFPYRSAALFRDEVQLRALLSCIGISIALHTLALFSFPSLRPSAPPHTTMVLTAFFAPRPAAVAAEPQKRVPRVIEPAPRSRSETSAPVLNQHADPAALPKPAASAPVPEPSSPSAVVAAQPTFSSRARDPNPPAVAEGPRVEGLDAGMLEKYRLALIDAARRYRRYPMQAMDRGWQGRVEIRLVIDASGTLKNAVIKTSSRYAVLDDQALDMVKKGKSLAKIPPALSGREFTVDVPVIFELRAG